MGKSSANEGFCWKIIELNAGIVIAMFDCESVSRVDIRYCQVLMFSGFQCCWASQVMMFQWIVSSGSWVHC